MPKDGAPWDGQIPQFYIKWQNLTVPRCSILRHGHYRIDQIVPRVVQRPFRCSAKQHTSHTDLSLSRIGHHMGQNAAHAWAWGAFFKSNAVAYTKWRFWPPMVQKRLSALDIGPCGWCECCSCYRSAAGATLQGLCRKGYAVWGYAAGAMLHESWIMADDDDGW